MPAHLPVRLSPPVAVRRIRCDDLDRLRCFVRGLSPQSGYQRLLSGRRPTEDELRRWACVDGVRETAFVAVWDRASQETIAAVARYVRDDAGAAEFAIVVDDLWQRRGLGTRLVRTVIDSARQQGVLRLHGLTLSTNVGMIGLARRFGFQIRRSRESAAHTVLELDMGKSR